MGQNDTEAKKEPELPKFEEKKKKKKRSWVAVRLGPYT
jgi:hypothetical protein